MLNNQIILNGITIQQLAEALAPLLQITTVQIQQLPEFIGRKEACEIMNITAHSSERMFLAYIGKPNIDYALQMMSYLNKLKPKKD